MATRIKTAVMVGVAALALPAAASARGTKLPGDGAPESVRYYETVAMMSPSAGTREHAAVGGVKTADVSFFTLGRQFDLKLEETHPFAPGATVHWIDDSGEVVEPAETNGEYYSGRVEGDPHSWARVTMRGNTLAGVVSTDDELYFLEPASRFFGEEVANETLAYRMSDTDSEWEPGSCGAIDPPSHHHQHTAGRALDTHAAMQEVLGAAVTAAASGTLQRAQIGMVADYLYFSKHGATSASDIAEIINNVDGIYQAEVGVTIQILSTVVFTTQASDPFFNTGTDANTLLTAFTNWRSANDTNSSQPLWNTDISHLITGRDINGACPQTGGCPNNCCVIGLSYIGTLCDPTYGAGIDQDFTTAVNLLTLLLAHEMGHNFGAYHDAQANSACPCCAGSPGTFIMNPVLSSSLQQHFSDCTKSFINPDVSAASCFDTVQAGTPTPYAAVFVSQAVPGSMTAGQSYTVSVTMQNTGSSTWTAAGFYRLGAVNPYDNTTWGMNRVGLASGDSVAPGQQKTFTWTVQAPATAGTYNFQWRMVRDGVTWFGDLTPNVAATVTAATGPDAVLMSQSVPSSMSAGQLYSVSVTMKNTGTTTWTAASLYRLGAINPYDNFTWGMNRVTLVSGDSIAPGQQKTFTWTVQAPATAGTYNFQWRMVQDGVTWFGTMSTNMAVTVNGSTPDASYGTQNVPTTMSVGQQYTVSVTMQNTGGTTWTAATMYRLGAVNPYDNATWGMNRVGLASGDSIAPGEQKTFTWTVPAPATAGTYNFQWRMVQDGVTWFGDTSANVAVVVQ